MIDNIFSMIKTFHIGFLLKSMFDAFNSMWDGLDFILLVKIACFIGVSTLLTVVLLLVNDWIFDRYVAAKRTKRHHLTLTNRGNVPSIFLLRTVELPKQIAVRFRVGDSPMIWVSRRTESDPETDEKEQLKKADGKKSKKSDSKAASDKKGSADTALVPNLDKPFAVVDTAKKEVGKVAKSAGMIAGIISSVTSLLPWKSKALSDASDALKGFQQDSNNVIKSVNTKMGTLDTLSGQINNLAPKGAEGAAGIFQSADPMAGAVSAAGTSGGVVNNQQDNSTLRLKDFIYDEEVWQKNIDKVDENGGSLNYVQSKILEPGESMRIDVDIMNLSESVAPLSLLYKIELLQLPQTNLQLAAPKEYISGIVIFPKASEASRILPGAVMVLLLVLVIQLLAGLSHLLF